MNIEDSRKVLEELHESLADALLEKIRNGEATPADLSVARQFLKDNGVDAVIGQNAPITRLALSLPFENQQPIEVKGLTLKKPEPLSFKEI